MQKNSCRSLYSTSFKRNPVKIGRLLAKIWIFKVLTKNSLKWEKSTIAHLQVSYMTRIFRFINFWSVRLFSLQLTLIDESREKGGPPHSLSLVTGRQLTLIDGSRKTAGTPHSLSLVTGRQLTLIDGSRKAAGTPLPLPFDSGRLLRAARRPTTFHFTANFKAE